MAKAADIGSKRLISIAPNSWLKWATQIPDVVAGEILNSEFQWISRESDVLIKAKSPTYGDFLVLNELQLRYKPSIPKRMRAYAALAEEKCNLLTYPVLINILREGDVEIPTRYESEFAGLQARQDYRVINLWEVDVEIAFEEPASPLIPFVPVLKGGAQESTIQRALRVMRTDEELSNFETVMAFFASFVLESRLVRQIMRWDMAVLSESPWYQEILQQGQALGLQQGQALGLQQGQALGLQQGQALGLQQGIQQAIEVGLEFKFGSEGLQLMPEISQISDLERLKAIQRSLITANTLDELRRLI